MTTEEIRKLPRTKVEAKDKDGKPVTYTGVALHHLLNETQTPLGESLRAGGLRCYLSVEARDGYRVLFSLPEIDPAFTDRTIILADELNSKPLDDRNGPYQIIVPDEKRHARWVRMVETIRILESKVPSDANAPGARQLPPVDKK
jgi:Oxidoreductase molybdopterin binding domain